MLQRIFVSERGDGVRNESIKFYYLLLLLTVGSNSESVLKLISDIVTRILEMDRPIKWLRIKCGYPKKYELHSNPRSQC
jgi:hypothetical protein